MNKPKELIGKVKKFEEIQCKDLLKGQSTVNSVIHQQSNCYTLLTRLRHFYTQPFKPEMIEEYFVNSLQLGEARALAYQYEVRKLTLSDFIDACINSNIELEWK